MSVTLDGNEVAGRAWRHTLVNAPANVEIHQFIGTSNLSAVHDLAQPAQLVITGRMHAANNATLDTAYRGLVALQGTTIDVVVNDSSFSRCVLLHVQSLGQRMAFRGSDAAAGQQVPVQMIFQLLSNA